MSQNRTRKGTRTSHARISKSEKGKAEPQGRQTSPGEESDFPRGSEFREDELIRAPSQTQARTQGMGQGEGAGKQPGSRSY